MATHSSILAWRIPGAEETGGLPSMGSHRVRHNWSDLAAAADTPFYLLLSPVGCWYHTGSVTSVLGPLLFKFWGLWRKLVINFTEHVVGLNGFDFALLVALWYAKNFFFTFCNHFLRISEEVSLHSIVILFDIFYPTFSKKTRLNFIAYIFPFLPHEI